jgi:hypothetical protein
MPCRTARRGSSSGGIGTTRRFTKKDRVSSVSSSKGKSPHYRPIEQRQRHPVFDTTQSMYQHTLRGWTHHTHWQAVISGNA